MSTADAMEKVRAGICSLDDTLTEVRRDELDSGPDSRRTLHVAELCPGEGTPDQEIESRSAGFPFASSFCHSDETGRVGIAKGA